MFPPFPQAKAKLVLEEAIELLREDKIRLIQTGRISRERENQGVMLGVLVCSDENGREVNLLAASGNSKKLSPRCTLPNLIFVDSIVPQEKIDRALDENDRKIHELTEIIKSSKEAGFTSKDKADIESLKKIRSGLCEESLRKVHDLYSFHCIDGKVRSLKEICLTYNRGKLPPTGTGDCSAPKLLDYSFSHGLKPLSLAESFYNEPSGSDWSTGEAVTEGNGAKAEVRKARPEGNRPNLNLIAPCDERCGILLSAMLGLRILYMDDDICIVNKQSGLLSVPGRGEDKKDCVESRFKALYGSKVELPQPAVHRLDMETSGIMILAFTKEAHRELNRQFEAKEVQKEYVALLDGILPKMGIAPQGRMELFFRLDVDNRPHQIWDAEKGKSAITEWEILGVERYHAPDGTTRNASRVLFKPHTGRTHQLRLASSDSHGFGCPIIGDTLYGHCEEGERLMLHAKKITFRHPVTSEMMTIECPPEF